MQSYTEVNSTCYKCKKERKRGVEGGKAFLTCEECGTRDCEELIIQRHRNLGISDDGEINSILSCTSKQKINEDQHDMQRSPYNSNYGNSSRTDDTPFSKQIKCWSTHEMIEATTYFLNKQEQKLKANQCRIEYLLKENSKLKSRINSLEDDNNQLRSRIDYAEFELLNFQHDSLDEIFYQEIDSSSGGVNSMSPPLKTSLPDNQDEIEALRQEVKALKIKNDELKETNNIWASTFQTQHRDMLDFNKKKSLEIENQRLRDQVQLLENRLKLEPEILRQENDNFKRKIKLIEKDLNNERQKVRQLEKRLGKED